MKICVVGSGSWGIASSLLLSENGHDVTLWSFDEKECAQIKKERSSPMLEGVVLPERVEVTTDISRVSGCPLIVLVTPSFAVRDTCVKMEPYVEQGQTVVLLSKGFDPGAGHRLLSELAESTLPKGVRIAVLSGPSHAEEVSRGVLTAVTAASSDREAALLVQRAFTSPFFRVYTSSDIIGVQLGGAIKNVIAIASGISSGMGFGDNTRAMLITRGVTEVARLGEMLGGRKETFWGLSGIGDTIVTCTSMHSRNFKAGLYIGRGMSPDDAIKEVGATVEGYYAALAVHELRKGLDVYLPLCDAMYKILYEKADINDIVASIFESEGKEEFCR